MSLSKFGVEVCCQNCHCVAMDEAGGFDIDVPVELGAAGHGGVARLHCSVSAEQHRIEFVDWVGDVPQQPQLSEEESQRVAEMLDYVAEKRICGNSRVCPSEVVRIVEGRKRS